LLKMYAKQGDKILDTHLGSGTLAIACCIAQFDLTACEINSDYYQQSIEKIKNNLPEARISFGHPGYCIIE
ncbi:site-specific DNA-methyltransferase, partial [Neisseria meningitidis]|nr:site-specific DNA-methyltransferase [Neisseria meningitidis]